MIELIVFDLDGTLVKSHKTIYKATIATLEKLGLQTELDEDKFYSLLGHHFGDIFRECNIEVPDVEYFIKEYKDLYFNFIDESELYPNVLEVLQELKRKNIKTGMLTTKGHDQAINLSEHFNFDTFLDEIKGRLNGVAIKPAPDQFLEICKSQNCDPKTSLMVGDTELDIMCGRNAGATTCAVSYGYRDVEEIKALKPDYLIDDLEEILDII